ncbi:multidrug efflux RND transporter permease subunit [Paraburkholderia silviterrae]|uniref:Efflux pump membrane transporter n=1 Tax=Paraburkholderia silviterrae TaxID=2528715 RepID=A0A4R5M1B3_9BURK|nr:multidrug efflux RND transporter permease subunit [Paraburkholderia silviterrae]TDG19083.1 multidrug efflux RND transporter permease subunit [Paraburkholderia silviterrae]
MPFFFIDRPVFAWVIALAVMVAGVLAIPMLPVAQYPRLSPPRIVIYTQYPGASPEEVDANVASVIEESLDGIEGLQYYETTSDALGNLEIDVTFAPDSNPDIALVDVQNRLKQVEARLPQPVVQQGIDVEKAANTFLMLVALTSTDGTRDSAQLSDYLNRFILRDLKRAPGVGAAELWDSDEAMRVWLDPVKLREYGLTAAEVNLAISAQNAPVTAGTLGNAPFVNGQQTTESVSVKGQLDTPGEFGQIVLKAKTDGSLVRLGDIARVELGRADYSFYSRLNGRPAATVGIQLGPRGNALETSNAIRARLAALSKHLPPGVAIEIPFDTAYFVRVAIHEVVITLIEAVVLVFAVMWLFLRDLRSTLVPTVVIPVTLMGAFLALYAGGMSINVFTMFGLVLAIGILVDDAIVVVESVHRVMHERGLPPREATRAAMKRIGGAIVGVTAVLTAVFVPMLFFNGNVGGIYRQFAVAMIASMLVSSFMALSLTPALCANLLRMPKPARKPERGLAAQAARASRGYRALVSALLRRGPRVLTIYVVLCAVGALLYWKLPQGFLPSEDEGQLQVMIQLPAGATQARTLDVVKRVEAMLGKQQAVGNVTSVVGWSFAGSGQNVAMAFVELKPWGQRGKQEKDAQTLRDALNEQFATILDGDVQATLPSAVPGIGHAEGFTYRLEDRGGTGMDALKAARDQLIDAAGKSRVVAQVHSEDLPDAPRVELDVDRNKAYAYGVSFDRIADVLGSTFGSNYVDDFPAGGRMRRVIVAADAPTRMSDSQLLDLPMQNSAGGTVAMSSIAATHWTLGPVMLSRYNGYPSLDVTGRAAPGHSSGEAMAEMERLALALPEGVSGEWTDAAFEEAQAARQTPLLLGLSLLAVFMVLAALYESWITPLSVLLVVPLGAVGAVSAMLLRGLPNDIYFKVGMVTVIGLAAKNAILIVQAANVRRARGVPLGAAVVGASGERLRPIVMTSAAFLLGVLPLVISQGGGAESRHSIGTGVFGGVIAATLLGLVVTPVLYYTVVSRTRARRTRSESPRHREQGLPQTVEDSETQAP